MLRVEERQMDDVMVVDVIGRLAVGGETLLKDKVCSLVQQGHGRFVLNLEGVRIMDSPGFGALIACGTAVARAGGRLVIANAAPRTSHLLIIAGLLTHFPVFDSEASALEFVRRSQSAWTPGPAAPERHAPKE